MNIIEEFKERVRRVFMFGKPPVQPMEPVPHEKCGAAWPVSVPVGQDVSLWGNLPGCPSNPVLYEGSTRVVGLAIKQTEAPPLSIAELMDMLKTMEAIRGKQDTIEIEVSEKALMDRGAKIVGHGRISIGGHVFRYRHLVSKGEELK